MAIGTGENFLILEEERALSSLHIVQTGATVYSPGVRRLKRKFDRSPPSSAEV
jgi:hypothetical protein